MNFLKTAIISSLATNVLMGYNLEFTKVFTKEIVQDEIYARVNIQSNTDTQREAIRSIKPITKFINKNAKVRTKNLNQSIYPIYKTSSVDRSRYLDSYRSIVNLTLASKNSLDVTIYLNELLEYKTDHLSISYSQIGYKVSKELQSKTYDILRLDAIQWSTQYSEELNEKLNLECKQLDINFNKKNFHNPYGVQRMSSKNTKSHSSAVSVLLPEKKIQTVKVDVLLRYSCNER